MKVKVNRVCFSATIILIAFILCSGCATAPSGITELGNESLATEVSGDALYFGWFGLESVDKPGVYQKALKEAIGKAQEQGYAAELSDVKVWTTQYLGPQLLFSTTTAALAVFTGIMGSDSGTMLLQGIISLGVGLIAGLEIEKYTVVGVPVEQ